MMSAMNSVQREKTNEASVEAKGWHLLNPGEVYLRFFKLLQYFFKFDIIKKFGRNEARYLQGQCVGSSLL